MHPASITSTFVNCLGREYLNWTIDGLPLGYEVLFNQLPSRFSKDIVVNNTMTPYYKPFALQEAIQ